MKESLFGLTSEECSLRVAKQSVKLEQRITCSYLKENHDTKSHGQNPNVLLFNGFRSKNFFVWLINFGTLSGRWKTGNTLSNIQNKMNK